MTFIPMQGKCPHCGRDDCMPELTTLNQRIADLEAQLQQMKLQTRFSNRKNSSRCAESDFPAPNDAYGE